MNDIAIQYYPTAYGELILGVYQQQLCLCDWRDRKMRSTVDDRIKRHVQADYVIAEHPLIDETIQQLSQFFAQTRTTFNIPLLLLGSDFQQKVWRALIEVPYGTTATYLALSERIGNKKAVRAVANANGANSLSIIVPCHRIIGSNGQLTGYAGGLPAKEKLLALESDATTSIE